MGVEPAALEQTARDLATERGWQFETIPGDMRLIDRLVNGNWDEEAFLRIPPGHSIKASHNNLIVKASEPEQV